MGLEKEYFKMKLLKTMIDLKYNILNEVKNIFLNKFINIISYLN